MATGATSPSMIAGFSMAKNPTITEHDFRFPRRPFEAAAGADEMENEGSPGDLRIRELNLDTAAAYNAARYDVLRAPLFPHLEGGMSGSNEALSELQARDPLAMTVWKFFSKTKQSLPRQERMENFTWRMQHVNLQKLRNQQGRHDELIPVHGESCHPPFSTASTATKAMVDSTLSTRHTSNNNNSASGTANAPSGIAQLRKATDQNVSQPEPMNLDDFVFADNVAPSAGFTPSLKTGNQETEKSSTRATAAAIPIKSRKASGPHFVPQSVPVPPHQRTRDEFGYVTRNHRKTSIDERRVSGDLFQLHLS
ncbi:hypothetical protein F5B21DRAFT_356832 [Xylaria acuta]|nr:hypothetical protein F5B21DRAFT_356832 [Xylaria acuta]